MPRSFPANPYAAHSAFVAPARARAHLGALVLGLFIIEILNGFLVGLLRNLVVFLLSDEAAKSVFRGDTTAGLLIQLFSFALLTLSVVLVARNRHARGFFSLTGPPLTAIRQFRTVLPALVLVLLAIEIFPPWWSLPASIETRPALIWIAVLPLSLAAILVQTSAEEIFYRGYLQQQIAARFNHPAIWLIAPNILFALSHVDNGSSGSGATDPETLQYVIWAFFFGLAASDLTGRTGTLGAAIAFHLVNNAYAFLFFGEQGGVDSGLALWLFPSDLFGSSFGGADGGAVITVALITEIAIIGCMWLAARVALRR